MKTNYLFLTLAATLLLGSCAKEMTSADSSSATPEDNGQVVIQATLADGQDTKTVLNGDGSVFWQPGDEIAVFFNSVKVPFTAYNNVNAASALFVGNSYITTGHNENSNGEVGNDYSYWGLYPYHDVKYLEYAYSSNPLYPLFSHYLENYIYFWRKSFSENYERYYDSGDYLEEWLFSPGACDGNRISTRLFYWQQGVANTFERDLNIAVAKSNDYKELSFYNVLGGVRFSVNADNITRVTFRGNNGEALAGDGLVIGMNAEGRPEVTEIQHPEKTITVSLAEDKPFVPGVWYYALMVPTQLAQGYTMELYTATSKAVKTVTSPMEVKRSVFGSLAAVDNGLSFSEPVVYPKSMNKVVISGDGMGTYWKEGGSGYSGSGTRNYDYTIMEGHQVQLNPQVTPSDCTFPARYESYSPDVASVDDKGVLKALRAGETDILCLVDDQYCFLSVKVIPTTSCFSLDVLSAEDSYSSTIYVGDTLQLFAIPDPANCPTAPVWTSSDESIATVSTEGVVKALAPGSVTIKADIAGTSDTYSVKVLSTDLAQNVEILVSGDVDTYNLYTGDQIQLSAVVYPESYTGPITWTSDDTSVAVVDEKGLVTCVGEGDARISVSVQTEYGERDASERIRVEQFTLGALYEFKDGKEVTLDGYLVYATNLTGFVIGDDYNNYFHVYQGSNPAVVVHAGDYVQVKGTKATIHDGAEISQDGLSVKVLSSGNVVPEVSWEDARWVNWKKVRPIRAEGYLRRASSTMYILYKERWTDSPWIYFGHNDETPASYVYEKVELTGFSLFPSTGGTAIIDLNNMMITGINCENYHALTTVKDVIESGSNGEIYRVKGTVTSVADVNYGNFYIKDDSTDTALWIYGTKDWSGRNPKDMEGGWTSYGISVGSEVEVFGERALYGSTVELVGVRIVSVKN